jgi:hypothetical protein
MNYVAILTFTVCATVSILALAGIWMAIEKALGVPSDAARAHAERLAKQNAVG